MSGPLHCGIEFPVPRRYLVRTLWRHRTVMLKQRIMCMLGAAIVLIVLSLAPSVAQPHAAHMHHAAAHIHGGPGHATAVQSERPATQAVLQQAQRGQTETPASSERNCVGACCTTVCASCCAAGLPNFVQLVPLFRSATRVALVPAEVRADRAPESLRRPPKPFI